MLEVDIIILSFAKDEVLRETTENAVKSLLLSESDKDVKFNNFLIISSWTFSVSIHRE